MAIQLKKSREYDMSTAVYIGGTALWLTGNEGIDNMTTTMAILCLKALVT